MPILEIKDITLNSPTVLAPMAGITDRVYRKLCKSFGVGLLVSEMISAKALHYGDRKTETLTAIDPEEGTVALQIFGSDPAIMAEAAAMLSKRSEVSLIDLNFGCPAPKIVKNGDGSALMKNLPLAYEVMKEVVSASAVPVTMKCRMGWDEGSINAHELVELAQKAGIAAITVHARTREMFYSGEADWTYLESLRPLIGVPFIGNGDIFTAEDGLRMIEKTGVDGVAIGRGAIGNPWIFQELNELLETGTYASVSNVEKLQFMRQHLELNCQDKGDQRGVAELKKPMAQYVKGMCQAKRWRDRLSRAQKRSEVEAIIDELLIEEMKSHGQ